MAGPRVRTIILIHPPHTVHPSTNHHHHTPTITTTVVEILRPRHVDIPGHDPAPNAFTTCPPVPNNNPLRHGKQKIEVVDLVQSGDGYLYVGGALGIVSVAEDRIEDRGEETGKIGAEEGAPEDRDPEQLGRRRR